MTISLNNCIWFGWPPTWRAALYPEVNRLTCGNHKKIEVPISFCRREVIWGGLTWQTPECYQLGLLRQRFREAMLDAGWGPASPRGSSLPGELPRAAFTHSAIPQPWGKGRYSPKGHYLDKSGVATQGASRCHSRTRGPGRWASGRCEGRGPRRSKDKVLSCICAVDLPQEEKADLATCLFTL